MIFFIKKYLKYVISFFVVITLFFVSYAVSINDNVSVSAKQKTITEKQLDNKDKDTNTIFVDVKGAVNTPGVYELEKGKRVVDAVEKAGGLASNANTININLSKRLEDEMVIVIYTKNEIAYYKNNKNTNKISCASNECVCPDSNNKACITSSNGKSSTTKTSESKVSINSASKEVLMTLSGVGESKANAIISYRQENGSFDSIEDIKKVSGIGESLYNKIKDNITL